MHLLNAMLAGRVRREFWTPSRAVLIPKGSDQWRPLGIGESWYRLMGRCAMQTLRSTVGPKLTPLQLGVGVSGGCEIAGRLAQLMLDADSDNVLINLDLANAFNTIPREMMWTGLRYFCPELAHWFLWAYGAPTELRTSDGMLACMSETGSRQGDPLASLIFCVGFHAPLDDIVFFVRTLCGDLRGVPAHRREEVAGEIDAANRAWASRERRIRELSRPDPAAQGDLRRVLERRRELAQLREDRERERGDMERRIPDAGGVVAYMDDVNIFVPREHLPAVSAHILRVFTEYGMTLNVHKCKVLSLSPNLVPRDCPFPFEREGTLSMGVPTGTDAYRSEATKKTLDDLRVSSRALQAINPAAAYAIIRYAISARPGYLARVTERDMHRPFFEEFDSYIDGCIRTLLFGADDRPVLGSVEMSANTAAAASFLAGALGTPLTPADAHPGLSNEDWVRGVAVPLIRGLPLQLGGLALPRYGGAEGDRACLMSRAMVRDFLMDQPRLRTLRVGMERWQTVYIGLSEERRGAVAAFQSPDDEEHDGHDDADPEQWKKTVRRIQDNIRDRLLAELQRRRMDGEQAWFRSSKFKGSGKWLYAGVATGPFHGPYRFEYGEFLDALRLRCLVNPIPSCTLVGGDCRCLCGTDLRQEPYHALDCLDAVQGLVVARHNHCRDLFAKLLRGISTLKDGKVHTEVLVGNNEHAKYADVVILPTEEMAWTAVDLSIVDPAAPSYRSKVNSHHVVDAATAERARVKRTEYARANVNVAPLIIDATGRLGKDAISLFRRIGDKLHKDLEREFTTLAGLIIQRGNARVVGMFRSLRNEAQATRRA